MAKGGEIYAVYPDNGRAFPDLLTYTHYELFKKGYQRRNITPPSTLDDVANVDPIVAHVSNDAWVADCPDCGGADIVFLATPLLWCHECGNAAVGGKWRPVVLPEEHENISAILDMRPRRETRNWRPYETVQDLREQNIERGDPF